MHTVSIPRVAKSDECVQCGPDYAKRAAGIVGPVEMTGSQREVLWLNSIVPSLEVMIRERDTKRLVLGPPPVLGRNYLPAPCNSPSANAKREGL